VNAIHALSQLSYAPAYYCPALERHRGKLGNVARARVSVNEALRPNDGPVMQRNSLQR
jgi:hypothetical protein